MRTTERSGGGLLEIQARRAFGLIPHFRHVSISILVLVTDSATFLSGLQCCQQVVPPRCFAGTRNMGGVGSNLCGTDMPWLRNPLKHD